MSEKYLMSDLTQEKTGYVTMPNTHGEIDWEQQAIRHNRAAIRLEALKVAAGQKQYTHTQQENLLADAEELYNWIVKPE